VLSAGEAMALQFRLERERIYLPIWTITSGTTDYPDHFVARLFLVGPGAVDLGGTNQVLMAGTLDDLRAQLPPHLTCQPRDDGDDPVIVENWL
jgi:hypothetical protein